MRPTYGSGWGSMKAERWDAQGWAEANLALFRRSGSRCECCGRDFAIYVNPAERHHRQRRAVGGDHIENLLVLRRTCHAWWHAHPTLARERGIIVSPWEPDPAGVPVQWNGRWRLLDDLGGAVPVAGPLLPSIRPD